MICYDVDKGGKHMKKLCEAIIVLSLALFTGNEILENGEDRFVCTTVENEKGEIELVCISEEDTTQPLIYCTPDCWGNDL